MGGFSTTPTTGERTERLTLSTGHTVELPLSTSVSIVGVVLPARRGPVSALVPDGLSPLHLGGGRAAVTVLSVSYDRIGDDAMAPYDEFSVAIPVVEDAGANPLFGLFSGAFGGYVWYMPVTTEAGRALGVEGWGYPKTVADIEIEDDGSTRRTTVSADGQTVVSTRMGRPETIDGELGAASYSIRDGQLLREDLELDGELGLWPWDAAFDFELGDHPRAATLRGLDLGDEPVVTLVADGEFVIHPGEPIS